ncbi:hypothetical protein AYL99_07382 [Fonsecaea erecta]|uniref:Uncharacterized protein n=1 Tax=Fonsecaea erecta TaxID=1367422 RepID=A0A178ZF82_9EURO|nr:hypothetical protein AYL99_07382 [Fonsecaea erecta]OAP58292.1 hypothetical protein AYL99_07382 [Fonsecaea erecta]
MPDETSAQAFIKTLPRGDRRRNWEESRFRLLCIKVQDRSQLSEQTSIVNAAVESGWIHGEFARLIQTGTTGSAVLTENGNISLILQMPKDQLPFITLSISELPREGRYRGSDWVCLLLIGPGINLESLLSESSFPYDYASLSPDFMFLPVSVLQDEVERVGAGLMKLKKSVLDEQGQVLSRDPRGLDDTKNKLFELERTYLELYERWKFGQSLAENLTKCFGEIVRLQAKDNDRAKYSRTLSQRVETQITLSNMTQQELDAIPSKLKQQHRMIDSKLSIMIAEDTRRDSSSMKTMAVLTLLFLPATALASIFGMSMFDWEARDGKDIVSRHFWVYVVVAVPLTLGVLAAWILWYSWTQKTYARKWQRDIRTGDAQISKQEV